MIVKFSVSNFLSFDEREILSLEAGKARKHAERVYVNRRLKVVKCETMFGANASGKSNLIEAIRFIKQMVENGLPRGFSNKYYRLKSENKSLPSAFEIEFICKERRFNFGFSIVLNSGSLEKEWLYEITPSGNVKYLYKRDILQQLFEVGDLFRDKDTVSKLKNYGEDSSGDQENLFLTIINKNKGKMYTDFEELSILRDIFLWFVNRLNVSIPEGILTGYPYFKSSNLNEIAELLNALGTGIQNVKIADVPIDVVKSKVPDEIYNRIISELERENARVKKNETENRTPSIMVRAYKEFYTFEIDQDDNITIRTIEFSHESGNVYFGLHEESDGTARLLDLIEIFFKVSDDSIYVIDEIDRCLHPAMTVKLIGLFLEKAKTRNTQLIITTHESRLLKNDLLRNDEISFMIKTDSGSTIIKSLEQYQLRSDKKVYEALFDGTIDALPKFNDSKLNLALRLE